MHDLIRSPGQTHISVAACTLALGHDLVVTTQRDPSRRHPCECCAPVLPLVTRKQYLFDEHVDPAACNRRDGSMVCPQHPTPDRSRNEQGSWWFVCLADQTIGDPILAEISHHE